jgi:peptidoglycan/xylan/chitin deacetylase (PgdA/CDA1 family)
VVVLIALSVALTAACTGESVEPTVAPRIVPPPATTSTTAPAPALPRVVVHGSRAAPRVALTFDSNLTPAMIDELDRGKVASFDNRAVIDELIELGVPATFFLAGLWVERYPDEARRIAASPLFEVGSHSYSHRAFAVPCYHLGRLGVADMAADVARSEAVLRTVAEHPTKYFRFPGGCYDEAALDAIASTGVQVVQYDLPGGDAFGTSVAAIERTVLDGAQNGSIVVLHITGGNTAPLTADALPTIVDGLRQRGFQLVRLSDLLAGGAF